MIEHWYAALAEPVGLCLRVSDVEQARGKLYQARVAAMDPDLDALQILVSPTNASEIWIIRKELKVDGESSNGAAESDHITL